MPNIDTTTIDGFDAMTPEQKVDALLALEIPEAVDMTMYVPKETFDKKASEAANLSTQLKSKMSDDEAAKADAAQLAKETADRIAALEADNKALAEQIKVKDWTAKYMDMGYDAKLAEETAKAMVRGDADKVFANGAKFKENLEKQIKADLLRDYPKPGGSGGDGGKEDFAMEQAKRIGQEKAAANSAAADVMKYYT